MNKSILFATLTTCVTIMLHSHSSFARKIDSQKNREVLNLFEQISAIPRCSGNENKISQWLQQWSKNNGFATNTDKSGNLVIKIPASTGYENSPTIVIQGHLDMVCEKIPDSEHNFNTDPIRVIYDGEWLKADKTTLGADNGIGIALALSLAEDQSIPHPLLELLFTVDEEKGLTGANALEPGFISGKILLNIDSEEEGTFTIGCAGGKSTKIKLPISFAPLMGPYQTYELGISGLQGGHSGLDINKNRGNAIKVLANILASINQTAGIRLISITGGTAVNAIPRNTEATFSCTPDKIPLLKKLVPELEKPIKAEYTASERALSLTLSNMVNTGKAALIQEDSDKVIRLLNDLPNGVAEMSKKVKGLVETSNNLGIVNTKDNYLYITSNQRSSVMAKLDEITAQIEGIAAFAGASSESGNAYPAWQPDLNSPLLKRCKKVYKNIYKKNPTVEIIHAGLECGVIGAKYPDMDIISLGPTIKDPHSPEEKLHIPSVGRVLDFLAALLISYK